MDTNKREYFNGNPYLFVIIRAIRGYILLKFTMLRATPFAGFFQQGDKLGFSEVGLRQVANYCNYGV